MKRRELDGWEGLGADRRRWISERSVPKGTYKP